MTTQDTKLAKHPPTFFYSVTLTGLGTFISITFLFLETMVITRILDTAHYGTFALLVIVVNFLLMSVDFGGVTAVTQLLASSDGKRQIGYANSAILFRLFAVGVFSIIVWGGKNAFNLLDPSGSLVTVSFYIPFMLLIASLDEVLLAILQGKQLYPKMAVAQILRSVLRLGLTVFFLYVLDLGLDALIYSWMLSYSASVVYEYLMLPFPRRMYMDWKLLRELLRFGFPLQLNNFLWFASNSSQSLLLSIFIGPSAVAFFEVAMRIPNAVLRLSQSYTAVYFPTATKLLSEGKDIQARQLLERSLYLTSFLMGLVALVSVMFDRQIVVLLFSERYISSAVVFALLMLTLHMTILVTLMGYSLTAAGYPERSLAANSIRETFMFLTNLALIPVFGLIGPVYAKLMAYYLANPLSVWLLKQSKITIKVMPYVKQTMLLLLCIAVFWSFQPENIWIKVAIFFIFIGLNFLMSAISLDDLSLMLPERMRRKLSPRSAAIL
jgi:O-antigen/teichoic acid export membrane protein